MPNPLSSSAATSLPTAPTIASASPVTTALIVVLAVAALYFGQEIFVPFALAALLSFMLAPPVAWIRRWHVPRVAAVIAVVLVAFTLIGSLSVLVGSQIVQLAQNLPSYQQNMQEKIRGLRSSAADGGVVARVAAVFQDLSREISGENEAQSAAGPEGAANPPMPVRIEQPSGPLGVIEQILGSALGPVGTAGIVIVFVVFMLLEREDLRDRFIRLAGGDLHRTTDALNEAASRVSRFLLTQLVVNASYGVPIGLGLYVIGVPNAFLWGLLAMLLRFVPYLGPFIAALFPLSLAFAVDPGWSMLLWTAALLVGMELVSNNVVEPWLYGSSTGLSSVAIILAAIFWTMLWGPVGLILATPLTVCLVVMGRYIPQLRFLDVLLGSEPVLASHERFYQRLLAGNAEEAVELAELYIDKKPVLSFYDEVCLPALRLAEVDRHQGVLDADRRKTIADGALAVVRELSNAPGKLTIDADDGRGACAVPAGGWSGTPVVCIAGRGEHDDVAVAMLEQMLRRHGANARTLPAAAISPEAIGDLDLAGVEVVFVSYLHPAPQPFARYVCRRLRRRAADVKLLIGCWNLPSDVGDLDALAGSLAADAIVTSLGDAVRRIEALASGAVCTPMAAPPVPIDEQARLEALYQSGLLEARTQGHLDRVARKLAHAFDMPIALVSLIDESCQLWKGAAGLPDDLDATRQGRRETSICGHVVAADAPLVVADTARDSRFANNPFLRERQIRFYAGVPLRTGSGHAIGSLCVIDTKPRSLTTRDVKLMQIIADELMADLEQPTVSESSSPPSKQRI